MKKKAVIYEDEYPINKYPINKTKRTRKSINKNTFKNISFLYVFLSIIFIILLVNLYYTQKLIKYHKQNDIEFSKNENILNNNNDKYKSKEKKELDNKYANSNSINENFNNMSLQDIDLNIFSLVENEIKDKIELILDEQKFFHGLLRTIKPKKIVEIGVSCGGSAILILNAIKDIEGAKLFSIDRSINWYRDRTKKTGYLVQEKFPELMNKWTLYTGGLTSEFIETIGDGIDLAFIDTMHVTPGEMLDWLMVLPFLKNEAIVVFHDAFILYINKTIERQKRHTSNNQLMCYIRGELILPQYGNSVFFRNIGALKLSPEQKKYYYQYFLALGIQWEYMPNEDEIKKMRDFFMKYYGEKYVEVYDDAVQKNKIYLNKNY